MKFRVGVVVISTMFIAGFLVVVFGDVFSLFRRSYTVHIHFVDAPGVADGTPCAKTAF